ncbi:uncharacterized protein MYCFIDRAFT_209836 [Pseudocercospora fijiensis CIRAD86]|uniref:Uncharacterized protein n=1 Tax=Pseudocercospora fijiensis (strain CIRAD86) TaxID=383855 RepID=N1QBH1_PSEFD|nr:uncharacterized protein MYCFIDRAFT_209836 [Pseudocercospora fijiensis CIRAD86]EME88532.1 hypothetical protein MYCFIDRAFT_209836 [Pseudocercospora fijiensis CIRAD86]
MAVTQAHEADIWFNKLALKQQQAPLCSVQTNGHISQNVENDHEDFDTLDDTAGLGMPKKDETDSQIHLLLKKRNMSNDRLLETLIGKKAAEAKRKSQAVSKSNIASNHAAPKPVVSSSRPREDSSDDEEELGRASAFTSKRKTRDRNLPAYTVGGAHSPAHVHIDAQPEDPREDLATVKALANGDQAQKEKDSGEEFKPSRRKATSYLDELLSSKKKKKKKSKGKA